MDFATPTAKCNSSERSAKAKKLEFKFGLVVTNVGITRHDIDKDGMMMDGVWLDEESTISTLENILNKAQTSLTKEKEEVGIQITPANVLYEDSSMLVWYIDQRICHQWYLSGQKMLMNVPHPRILFIAAKDKRYMGLVAIPNGTDRPTAETPVYHCPVANVYIDMHMCIGSAAYPTEVNYSTMTDVEDVIFKSQYSGFKFDSMKSGDNFENFEKLQNKPEFPDELLKPAPEVASNVGEYIQVIKDRLAR